MKKFLGGVLFISIFIFLILVAYLQIKMSTSFEGKKWSMPALVYARPLELYDQKTISPSDLEYELYQLGYQYSLNGKSEGTFSRDGNSFTIFTRGFSFWDSKEPSNRVSLTISRDTIENFQSHLKSDLVRLDPIKIGGIYPGHHEDRLLIKNEDTPTSFLKGLVAVEDKDFYNHFGLSLSSIGRALIVNIKSGKYIQGGSTISQQLVKNFFLTNERTLIRKAQEALMAVLMEFNYSKKEIIETYLNEIYLGQNGKRAIHGFGLASQHYFGKNFKSLQVHEASLLIAMVKGPSYYNPRRHPKRAKKRRNLVIGVLYSNNIITEKEALSARKKPISVIPKTNSVLTKYPDYMQLVKKQLLEEYDMEDLSSEGLKIFTNLDPILQHKSDLQLKKSLKKFDKNENSPLEGAVVLSKVDTGEIIALLGSRDDRASGFNRALKANRPIGSLIKPAIYLTALNQPESYTLASQIPDTAVNVENKNDGTFWTPKNFDNETREQVSIYDALVHSYNLATIHMGLALGYSKIEETLIDLGITKKIPHLPSLFLGSLEMTPFEVTEMYQTIASGGFKTHLKSIHTVISRDGSPIKRYSNKLEKKFASNSIHLIQHAMLGTMREGTGRSAYNYLSDSLNTAGKTGTTNDQRDSWFAGFTGNILGVVWIGKDDYKPTQLTGSSGALNVWSNIIAQSHSTSIRKNFSDEITYNWVHIPTGKLSDRFCSDVSYLPFIKGSEPIGQAPCTNIGRSISNWFHSFFQ